MRGKVGDTTRPSKTRMKKLFEDPDYAKDLQSLKDYFFNVFLPDDANRGEDEESAREAMFNKLSKLAEVVESVKKKVSKQK